MAFPNDAYVSSSSGAKTIRAIVAIRAEMTMLAISQKPDLVSNILRSSTSVTRDNGTGSARTRARGARSTAMAVMLLLLLVEL